MSKPIYQLGTIVPGMGVIEAVKTNNGHRDYLLKSDGIVTWLDEAAIDQIFSDLVRSKEGE